MIRRRRVTKKEKKETKRFLGSFLKYGVLFCAAICILVVAGYVLMQGYLLSTIHTELLGNALPSLTWNQDKEVTILIGEIGENREVSHIECISFDESNIRLTSFPSNIYIGSIRLQDMLAIASLQDNTTTAFASFLKSFVDTTHIYIDGYFLVKNDQMDQVKSFVDITNLPISNTRMSNASLLFHIGGIRNVLAQDVYSNISSQSLYAMNGFLSSGTTLSTYAVQPDDLIAQNGVETINTSQFDTDIASSFVDTYLSTEHARISVYNGTGEDGQATLVATILKDEGAIIDQVGDVNPTDKTTIYIPQPSSFPYTLAKLKTIFYPMISHQNFTETSDISIVLGKDSLSKF